MSNTAAIKIDFYHRKCQNYKTDNTKLLCVLVNYDSLEIKEVLNKISYINFETESITFNDSMQEIQTLMQCMMILKPFN